MAAIDWIRISCGWIIDGLLCVFLNKKSGNTKTKNGALTYLQRYKDTFDQEMKKKQQELDDIENTKKQEHNKSMRPKKNNIHTVTSDNDGIIVSNKIHR